MIILDTNVFSGLIKGDPIVEQWLNGYDKELIWLNAITIMETMYGINRLPEGKKKRGLQAITDITLREDFSNRIIEFETNAAIATAGVMTQLTQDGKNVDVRDLQIAGIALAKGAYVATRNVKDFLHTGVALINPWE